MPYPRISAAETQEWCMVVLLGEAGGGNAFVPDIASASFPPPARTVIGRISNYNGSTRTRRDARHDCSIGGHRAGRSPSAKRFSLSVRVCMRARTRTVDCSPRSEPIRTPNVHDNPLPRPRFRLRSRRQVITEQRRATRSSTSIAESRDHYGGVTLRGSFLR